MVSNEAHNSFEQKCKISRLDMNIAVLSKLTGLKMDVC